MDNKHNEFVKKLRNIMRHASPKSSDFIKVVLESFTGISIICDLNMADSPMEIVRDFYEENPSMAIQYFSNQYALSRFMEGEFSEIPQSYSCFELLNLEGDSIKANWRFSLRDQIEIKEALNHIRKEGQIPTFVVNVSSGFA